MATGMDRHTGRAVSDHHHVAQSVADILTTPVGSRIERREYGSMLPELIDAPAHRGTFVQLYAATATALMRWEPRIRLTRVSIDAGTPAGRFTLSVEGNSSRGGAPFNTAVTLGSGGRS